MEEEKYPICTCGKVSFPSHKVAQTIITFFKQLNFGKRKIPRRDYFCEDCQGWHVTSRKKQRKDVQE